MPVFLLDHLADLMDDALTPQQAALLFAFVQQPMAHAEQLPAQAAQLIEGVRLLDSRQHFRQFLPALGLTGGFHQLHALA